LKYLYKNTDWRLFNLIVVDNGSRDGTRQWLLKKCNNEFPLDNSIFLLNNKNVGFGKAHNQAFQKCKTEFFLPLNNDTIPLKNWLEPLLEVMDNSETVAIAGCKLISPLLQGIQHAGVVFRQDGIPTHKYLGHQPDDKEVNRKGFCPAVTGAAMIIRSKIFKQIGGFDEVYLNGWEDIHMCLKVREMGHQVFYEPKSVLYHYEGQTDGRLDDDLSNKTIFMRRWYKKIMQWGNRDYATWKRERVLVEEVNNKKKMKKNEKKS